MSVAVLFVQESMSVILARKLGRKSLYLEAKTLSIVY